MKSSSIDRKLTDYSIEWSINRLDLSILITYSVPTSINFVSSIEYEFVFIISAAHITLNYNNMRILLEFGFNINWQGGRQLDKLDKKTENNIWLNMSDSQQNLNTAVDVFPWHNFF